MADGWSKIMTHPGSCPIPFDPYRHGYDPPAHQAFESV